MMGLWSEEKCTACQCTLRENRIVASFIHILSGVSLIFGFMVVIEIFQMFFGTELGLSFEYFTIGALLGIFLGAFLALWLHYVLVPFVKV